LSTALAVAVSVRGGCLGALVFWSFQHVRDWQPLMQRTRLIAEIVGATLERRKQDAALRASLAEIERLNGCLTAENDCLKEDIKTFHEFDEIVGESAVMRGALERLAQVAPLNCSVLLQGETGTGKELFARALHALSPRADGPFVAINCAAIPDTLLETELFGHEKGAFTGAANRKPGKFELAHRGTLFLDEIGDLPLALQPKILRALEERSFERVGGTVPLRVDVRVVAATNRGLKAAVAARQFREDLYFRLSVFPITVPPLRERPDDITLLARYFIERYRRDQNKKPMTLAASAEQALRDYPWPGNVRELQNCIERAVILADGDTIRVGQLSLAQRPAPGAPGAADDPGPWSSIDLSGSMAEATRRVVAEVERRKIEQSLKDADGNRLRAAELLQISQKAFLAKLRDYGLEN
jgi:transcriptional regulator with GAF, ATPase, and Fis domain